MHHKSVCGRGGKVSHLIEPYSLCYFMTVNTTFEDNSPKTRFRRKPCQDPEDAKEILDDSKAINAGKCNRTLVI
jgi:hypothetical protein